MDNLAEALPKEQQIRESHQVLLVFVSCLGKVYSIMKSSKVLVLPSTREGFGIIAIEANACGIPVITTTHENNATKELIKDGENGTLINLDDKELAKAILTIRVAKVAL